jgi:hypothetical protein
MYVCMIHNLNFNILVISIAQMVAINNIIRVNL